MIYETNIFTLYSTKENFVVRKIYRTVFSLSLTLCFLLMLFRVWTLNYLISNITISLVNW